MESIDAAAARDASTLAALFDVIRVRQWVKNGLILAPGAIAFSELAREDWINVGVMLIAWCFVASAGYVFNDFLDRESDRLHPIKRARPLASGSIGNATAITSIVVLLTAGLGLSTTVNVESLRVLALYIVINVLYTLFLKKLRFIDVAVLTGFYLLRLFAGSAACGIPMSAWFILTCYFTFFALSLHKRYMEIRLTESGTLSGRAYDDEDYDLLKTSAFISANAAIVLAILYMIFALQIVSPVHYVIFLTLATVIQLNFFDDRVVVTDDPIENLKSRPGMMLALASLIILIIVQRYLAINA